MGHNGNPNSLKNLERGRWRPGQSGNPAGRAKGVVYPSELLDGLLAMDDDGAPRYTQADLEAIVEDKDAAPALVIAARWLIDGMKSGERWILGKNGELRPAALDPTPSRVRESLADRLEGKPVQKLQLERKPIRPPAEIHADLVATLARALVSLPPAERAKLLTLLPVDAEDVEPVDGEAKVLPAGDDEPSEAPTRDCD